MRPPSPTTSQVRDLIIGNEPNLNRFWLPQFGAAGENVSAAAYLRLLSATYDSVKAVRDEVRDLGWYHGTPGLRPPRGISRDHVAIGLHSGLGAAYRQSGRARPVMDGFVHHPYPESADVPIDLPHPRSSVGLADYGKLVNLLSRAFDGTAQKGSDLPILYGEIGVETAIPAAKRSLYDGAEIAPTATDQEQAAAYRRTLEFVGCQANVAGVLFFHLRDEPSLTGWQSGVRYADGQPEAQPHASRSSHRLRPSRAPSTSSADPDEKPHPRVFSVQERRGRDARRAANARRGRMRPRRGSTSSSPRRARASG